jgi:hypothetical protein
MYGASSDRDHADEQHAEGPPRKIVPCAHCRTPVDVDPRTDSIFAKHLCDACWLERPDTPGRPPQ